MLPHDMVHCAVEEVLAARGFAALVDAGCLAAVPAAGTNAEAEAVERLVECLQAEIWHGSPGPAAELIETYRHACYSRGHAAGRIDPAAVERIRNRLAELTIAWTATPVGSTLVLALPGQT